MSNTKFPGPLVLVILDGWGISPYTEGNAVKLARTPVMDELYERYPNTLLIASGKKVGLPHNQRGNSEAGHMNLGAGRIAEQDVVQITRAIKDGTFFKNSAFNSVINHVKSHNSQLHLIGLLTGKQSAHTEMTHLYTLLDLLDKRGVRKVFLHFFTDGRDAPQREALKFLKRVTEHFKAKEKIATICGRFYSMDRNKIWERTEAAYDLLTLGKGFKVKNEKEAVLNAYNRNETDEFIQPTVITAEGEPIATINDNDGIIFYNLRSDRARQLTKALIQKDFNQRNPGSFIRKKTFKNISFAVMTDFGPDLGDVLTAFPSRDLTATLPMVMKDYKQLYISETEKYAHVTYFFNGGYADPVAGERRRLIPSPKAISYAEVPAMSAYEVTDSLLLDLQHEGTQFTVVNLCNPDMIGHTGVLKAGIKAVEVCDDCVGRIVKQVLKNKGVVIITADHGNVEEMIDIENGEIDTRHSIYPVPFILVSNQYKKVRLYGGSLSDVAPTILEIFGIEKPLEMSGNSLIENKSIVN
ncbi:2,3-bisphosphoglycerate-independent phosphoglycerate mutase [Patescibacteria group bacterium]|nr:2,3-bisphosphoglycerate-independent phosphoglycerate mutase [Patescibacteria group bacterium]